MSSPPSPTHIASVVLLVALLFGAWALKAGWIAIPERYNPWAELDTAEAPNLLTSVKLSRAQRDPARCLALLEASGMQFEPMPDRTTAEGCALRNTVRLARARELTLGTPVLLSCRAALAFALWERHVIQPAAAELLGTRIVRVDHLGGYACRNVVVGRQQQEGVPGRRSQHATADALDVTAYTRADRGRVLVIRRDWMPGASHAPTPEGAFLSEAHKGACELFDAVLGPDYNDVHADHFHLEVGAGRACR
ncbi:extensin family protein [Variovorax sp. J22P240]|uniref:extensin-like domain-containing protein n=1 Tax=Variovorax sp. J22P240 TaxID=3053514 RepID=UPI0025788C8B|nr:extensin family protein [Variovorax sp. J22P240]MDM0002763.1 extensin family protein [Variovorax sp. J22P240]